MDCSTRTLLGDVLAPRHGPTALPRSVASRISVACMCIHAQDVLVLFPYFKLTIKSVILVASVTSDTLYSRQWPQYSACSDKTDIIVKGVAIGTLEIFEVMTLTSTAKFRVPNFHSHSADPHVNPTLLLFARSYITR